MKEGNGTSEYVLELDHISKSFPGVRALSDVRFNLRRGEIHGLMGENGAGKSTFIKIITGVHAPEAGRILMEGREVTFHSPREAQRLGVAAIYQHVTCYPDLSVAENIFVGHERTTAVIRRIDWKTMYREAQALLDQLTSEISSSERMGDLSVARQQIVEIAKALSMHAKIVIMDEPTSALTRHESEELYRITRTLARRGVSVIFISHRMEDIDTLADRVTVFRDGEYINTWEAAELSRDTLIMAMVGREISQMFPKREVRIGEEVLAVEGLSRTGYFRDVSFSVRRGEIVALTGLVGAGRTEVCESIFGVHPADGGRILVEGREVVVRRPIDALRAAIGLLPEDRQLQGLVLEWDIEKNITLPTLGEIARRMWIDERDARRRAGELAARLAVKARTIFTRVGALSGGNQQKVVVAKIMGRPLKVIILDEPTKGVDVAAKAAIYEIIGELAEGGYGILLVSSEMPEVLSLSDRIVVMRGGRVTAHLDTAAATQELILEAAMADAPNDVAAVSPGDRR
ncbi:MAG: sugar ABC transporter ATP-binding protein [Spirochaetales bacterium]|nr:sugar ABC transporter ATP-binding protein [Spirochaetales bacterium]